MINGNIGSKTVYVLYSKERITVRHAQTVELQPPNNENHFRNLGALSLRSALRNSDNTKVRGNSIHFVQLHCLRLGV